MLMSHLLRVDPVVLGVRTHEPDVDDAIREVNLRREPVVVDLHVEDHAVAADYTIAPVLCLDLRRSIPMPLFDFAVPRQQRLLRCWLQLPEFAESPFRHDPHNPRYIDPISFPSRL